jgi:glycerol-3-phosphate dehydrogenase
MTGASIPRDYRGSANTPRVLWLSPLMRPLARVQAEELRGRGIDVLLVTTDQHPESDTARDYELVLEQKISEAPLLTIYGGKITTHRKLAEAAMEKIGIFFEGRPHLTANSTHSRGQFKHDGVYQQVSKQIVP